MRYLLIATLAITLYFTNNALFADGQTAACETLAKKYSENGNKTDLLSLNKLLACVQKDIASKGKTDLYESSQSKVSAAEFWKFKKKPKCGNPTWDCVGPGPANPDGPEPNPGNPTWKESLEGEVPVLVDSGGSFMMTMDPNSNIVKNALQIDFKSAKPFVIEMPIGTEATLMIPVLK